MDDKLDIREGGKEHSNSTAMRHSKSTINDAATTIVGSGVAPDNINADHRENTAAPA